jgi:hypothetical protein
MADLNTILPDMYKIALINKALSPLEPFDRENSGMQMELPKYIPDVVKMFIVCMKRDDRASFTFRRPLQQKILFDSSR